jgi:CubicO group peptidase (beta-lactamase class C family)
LNLANTTSGLPDILPTVPGDMTKVPADSMSFIIENFYTHLTEKDLYPLLHDVKLDTVPGFYPKHSNVAAQLLSFILQRVYNKSLNQLVKQYILSPLQMDNSSFAGSTPLLVKGYNGQGKQMPYFTQTYMQGSGGLRSSTADLLKYGAFLLHDKTPATQLVLKKTIGIDAGTNKVVSINPRDTVDDRVYSASLNWFQYQPAKGREQIWADGGTPGFCSYIVLYPQADLCVVLLSNKSSSRVFGELSSIAKKIFNLFPSR